MAAQSLGIQRSQMLHEHIDWYARPGFGSGYGFGVRFPY